MQTTSSSVDALPPIVDEKKKLIERGRVKTSADIKSIWNVLYSEDRAQSLQRSRYQEMLDGRPPIPPDVLKKKGLGGATNVNWNLAQQAQEEAEAPYNEILDSVDIFCSLPTTHGEPNERLEWEPIMAEEFTRCMRKWPRFNSLHQLNVHLFVAEGLSFKFFEDERDWRWKVKGQQHLKFPRATMADVNEIDVMCCKVATEPHVLYRIISSPGAEKAGWNVEIAKKALVEATKIEGQVGDDFQQWEAQWKNNDVSNGVKAQKLQLLHIWVQELDGTVTRMISREDGEEGILYKCEGKMRSMSECMTAYQYGIGTNGEFHSIRGLCSKIFPTASAINRVFNKFIDMACHVSTPHLQATSEDGISDMMMKPVGPYMVMGDGVSPAEIKVPNFDQTLLPVISTLQSMFSTRTSTYSAGISNQLDRTQRTATEKKMQYATQGKLSSSGYNLYFSAEERHWKQVVKRFKRENYQANEPGGDLVWEFRNRCLARGVPLKAIYQIDVDSIEVNTGIGKGSAAERMTALEGVGSTFNSMDAYAKNIYNRELVSAYWGPSKANIIFPLQPGQRPPVEAGMASMENDLMALSGRPQPVEPNQDHYTHLTKHMPFLMDLNQQIIDGTAMMEQAIPQMSPVWEHSNQHLELLPITHPERGAIKQALQQVGEVITNQMKKLNAEAQRAQDAEAEQQGMEPNGRTANDLIQATQAQMKLQALEVEKEYDLAKKQRELDHADKKFAQSLMFQAANQAVKSKKPA